MGEALVTSDSQYLAVNQDTNNTPSNYNEYSSPLFALSKNKIRGEAIWKLREFYSNIIKTNRQNIQGN